MYETNMYEGMLAETTTVVGFGGTPINAYFARPLGPGPFPGVVLMHHMPGWDEWYKEATRKFAHHGYLAICPDLYQRSGFGTPEAMAGRVRAEGGVPDVQVVGDAVASQQFLRSLPHSNGKVGIMGTCSGGRHAYLAACTSRGWDAVADLWGGGVVMGEKELSEKRPVAPIDYTKDLACPVLGLFGDEDRMPTPEQVTQHEEALKQHGKQYEFHMYPGAGHGFFYHHTPMYRQQAAVDGWAKLFDFFGRLLT